MTSSTGYGPHNFSILKYRVIYGDTDKMGVVYNANYLRWFEAARSSYMRRRELPYSAVESEGVQLPLTEANVRFHRPAMYEQLVDIKLWVSDITSVQVKFQYEVSYDDAVLARGHTHHAAINMTLGRPTRVPDRLAFALSSDEKIVDNPFY
jgi:acyl-CoA thioester hydrolase